MNNVQEWAKAALAFPNLTFVVIDTTGVEEDSDVLSLLTVGKEGAKQEQIRVRSLRHPASPNTAYTGISQELMDNCPQLALLWPDVQKSLAGKFVIGYNLSFVRRRLSENAEYYSLPPLYIIGECLQQAAVLYFRRAGWTGFNLKLQDACSRIGYHLPAKPDALDRAKGQLALLRAMAAGVTSPPDPVPVSEDEDELGDIDSAIF